MKTFVLLGSVNAFLGVALGAFGAHGLKERISADLLKVWETAVFYHLIHALGCLLVGILCHLLPAANDLRTSGWCLTVGIVLFSGSLYALVLLNARILGMITPFGGIAFLLGWLFLFLGVLKL